MYRACYETLEGVVNYGQGNLVKKKKKMHLLWILKEENFKRKIMVKLVIW